MSRWIRLLTLSALLSTSCYDFHQTGPEDPSAVRTPGLVSVTVEYRQPNGCLATGSSCDGPVVFFGSWMRPGGEFRLQHDEGSLVWRGTALAVPVNYPPHDEAYTVRVYDPYLLNSCTEGFQAERLRLGGETLTHYDGGGCQFQVALVFIDDNGQGHNPY